jgi:hypothetical protein
MTHAPAEPSTLSQTLRTPRRQLMNNPMFDWARRRIMRRRLAALQVALMLGVCSAAAAVDVIGQTAMISTMIALLIPTIVTMGHLNASIRGLTELKTGDLDEWQVSRRDATYRACWWPAIGFMAVTSGLATFGLPYPGLAPGLFLLGLFTAISLPVLTLAWSLPDEPGEMA